MDQNELRALIAYFDRLVKYSLLAIGTIIAIAGAFLWKNTSDLQSQAATSIKATQDSATHEISEIGKAAQNTAKSEAQKAIDVAFDRQNIQHLIEGAAQKKVDAAVETAVKKDLGARVDAFRDFVLEIGEINNHGAQLRLDYRSGLDYLLKARENPDPAVRAYSNSTLRLIAADYEYVVTANTIPLEVAVFTTSVPAQFSPKDLMRMIRTAQDPHGPMKIAVLFANMKGKVDWDVPCSTSLPPKSGVPPTNRSVTNRRENSFSSEISRDGAKHFIRAQRRRGFAASCSSDSQKRGKREQPSPYW